MDASRRLVRALAGSARAVEDHSGISGAQLFVLRQLDGARTPLSINELAERTLTHQSTVSGVVSRLAARRLVSRAVSADDKRRVEIALTARGRALVDTAPATVQTQLIEGLNALHHEQRATLADALEAWLAASGLAGEAAPLFFENDAGEPEARSIRPRVSRQRKRAREIDGGSRAPGPRRGKSQ